MPERFNQNYNMLRERTLEAFSGRPTLDTFLNSRVDGVVSRKRKDTIRALLDSYAQPAPDLLDSLFERAYDYGQEIDRLSLSPELREEIITEARGSIPAPIVETSPDGRVFLSMNPISKLINDREGTQNYDWAQGAYLMGISAGLLSLEDFAGLLVTDNLPILGNNPMGDLLATSKSIVENLIRSPDVVMAQLLPEIKTIEQYKASLFVTRILLARYVEERIAKIIQGKQRSMVSYARDKGNQKYSQWSILWENPQTNLVKQLFPEISPKDKIQFYKKAFDLAQVQLLKDVLKRDLEKGFVPIDIMKLINEYLLYCPSQNGTLDGFAEFVQNQRALLEQAEAKLAWNKPETVANYRDTALNVQYVPRANEEPIFTSSIPEQKAIGQPCTIELGVRKIEFLPDYRVKYPQSVVDALAILFREYNMAFELLVSENREWDTDYQYAFQRPNSPVNIMVQIDMVGLNDEYLKEAQKMDPVRVAQDLSRKIFEIENSIADYGYLKAVGVDIRPALNDIREQYGRPIALLATTARKYQEMRIAEFGEPSTGAVVDREKVKDLSGFDVFWGPDEFQKYLERNGACDYLLYVRSSAPKTQLRNPGVREAQPLLQNAKFRKVIRTNAITFNVDNPSSPLGARGRINDTKLYMPQIGMGYPVYCITDLATSEFKNFLKEIGGEKPVVRAKPALESYGGYGQLRGPINPQFMSDLNLAMKMRGPYILQNEKPNTRIIDENGTEFVYIDRNYLGWSKGNIIFLGGERTLMPAYSQEARSGRVHANDEAILANISLNDL